MPRAQKMADPASPLRGGTRACLLAGALACTVLLSGVAVGSKAFAQAPSLHWSALMRDGSVPMDSVRAAFEATAVTPGSKGKGFKPFQRWEAAFRKSWIAAPLALVITPIRLGKTGSIRFLVASNNPSE